MFPQTRSLLTGLTGLLLSMMLVIAASVAQDLGVTASILAQVESAFGTPSKNRLLAWQQLVAGSQALSEPEKLQVVNDFFNDGQVFVNDIDHWGVDDYWATPIEFLATGGGDCEDYSIAKFFTLRALGVAEEKLRITYVKARLPGGSQAHMVLTYFPHKGAMPLVLDNLNFLIKPASERRDLKPVYNFNAGGLYLASSSGSGKRVGGASRLSMWSDLQRRMAAGAWGG